MRATVEVYKEQLVVALKLKSSPLVDLQLQKATVAYLVSAALRVHACVRVRVLPLKRVA